MGQPLVASVQHGDQQALETDGIVAHEGQRRGYHLPVRAILLDQLEGAPGSIGIVGVGILGDPGLASEA